MISIWITKGKNYNNQKYDPPQNICIHLTLALTFKSIFSYSSQKTLSIAKETHKKESFDKQNRYRGNSTQIR